MDCNFFSLFYQLRSFSVSWKKEYKENRRKKREKDPTKFGLILSSEISTDIKKPTKY